MEGKVRYMGTSFIGLIGLVEEIPWLTESRAIFVGADLYKN